MSLLLLTMVILMFTPDKFFSSNYKRSDTILNESPEGEEGGEDTREEENTSNDGDKFERKKKYFSYL